METDMKLTVLDRVLLMNVLPERGKKVFEYRIFNDVKRQLSFTDPELTELKFKHNEETGETNWNPESPLSIEGKEFDFEPNTFKLLQDVLKEVEDRGEATIQMVPLYDKFESAVVK